MNIKKIAIAIIIVFILYCRSTAQQFSLWVDSERDSLEMGVTNELDFMVHGFHDVSALQLYFKLDASLFEYMSDSVFVNGIIEDGTDIFYHESSQTLILLYYSKDENGETLADTARLFSIQVLPKDSLACFSTEINTIDEYDEVIVERSNSQFIPVNYIDREICVAKVIKEEEEEELPDIALINFISPNGDGKNDQLIFKDLEDYSVRELRIFTMWGNEVYHSSVYDNDWDAVYQGKVLPDGNYYYVLEYGNEEAQKFGSMLTIQSN